MVWSNTGVLILKKCMLQLYLTFSADCTMTKIQIVHPTEILSYVPAPKIEEIYRLHNKV
jgi:hypothetical protein